ncbi:hypothetical protein ASPTUDRAFT_356422 [Aspergillus tubingensis CBS 134.48]|uniref:Uncharacterized protein n=1 Tax=Aspergillus tubingensis (strain CBS 134.48) TaxID=767770 RepID=A0A1L9NIE2_ASPTC|nr:hypothetical protein ASPTUDRAFT_356422 [Aspergillus tubingensis CBS 134.48]
MQIYLVFLQAKSSYDLLATTVRDVCIAQDSYDVSGDQKCVNLCHDLFIYLAGHVQTLYWCYTVWAILCVATCDH